MRAPPPLPATVLAAALPLLASCATVDPSPLRTPIPLAETRAAPQPSPVDAASGAGAPARRAALRFELGDDDFPSPMVDVVVSGQPTAMLVDTGATHQVIGAWVAEQIGPVTRSPGDVGVDHAGKALAISRLPGAQIVISGWGPIDASQALVVPLPGVLSRRGLGGVLSPQALASEGRAVVLDLRRRTMTEVEIGAALRALDAEPGAAVFGEVKRCGRGGGALPYVGVEIEGASALAQLDTGATQTTARAGSDVGLALAKRANGASTAVTASGALTVAAAEDTQVKLGDLEITTDVAIVPKEARTACPNDALLGMDVLRRCVIVLGASAVAVKCEAPR